MLVREVEDGGSESKQWVDACRSESTGGRWSYGVGLRGFGVSMHRLWNEGQQRLKIKHSNNERPLNGRMVFIGPLCSVHLYSVETGFH